MIGLLDSTFDQPERFVLVHFEPTHNFFLFTHIEQTVHSQDVRDFPNIPYAHKSRKQVLSAGLAELCVPRGIVLPGDWFSQT
jgi:hypothetical protein